MVVENQIVVELKAVDALSPIHTSQLLTYLKLGGYRLGYLMNFNSAHLRDGIKRVIR
jgi:GxxExxY protein